ncbi:MAG: hypothetical protein KF767_02830 [Bdellovibrionaceae bacterium]|nr:hypothetical protein [Pseudobdellovibrionaceae bacterium]
MSTMNAVSPAASPLTLGQLFDRGWNSIKGQIALVAGLSLVMLIGVMATGSLPFLGWAINALIGVGYIACLMRLRRGQQFEFADFLWAFQNMNRLIHVILAALIVMIAIVMGFIFLIIPGIWLWVMLSLTTVVQVKRDLDGVAAVKASYDLVTGNWWRVCGMMSFIVLLNIAGALCLMIGLLVTMPISYLIMIEMVDDLERQKGMIPADPAGAPSTPGNFQVNPS